MPFSESQNQYDFDQVLFIRCRFTLGLSICGEKIGIWPGAVCLFDFCFTLALVKFTVTQCWPPWSSLLIPMNPCGTLICQLSLLCVAALDVCHGLFLFPVRHEWFDVSPFFFFEGFPAHVECFFGHLKPLMWWWQNLTSRHQKEHK